MKIILTESQLKVIINESHDDYKQSSVRGKTIGKIYDKLNPNKEVSVGLGSGEGFTSKYENSEAKRKSAIAKEKEERDNAFKKHKSYIDINNNADKIKQSIIDRKKTKTDTDIAIQYRDRDELKINNRPVYDNLEKLGLLDKVFPPKNIKSLDLVQEQRVVYDKSKTDNIVNSFQTQGHHKWFDNIDPEIYKEIPKNILDQSLKYGLGYLTKIYGYNLKRVVVKDKNVVVGFLIWTNKGKELDDLGDNQTYPVILATAIQSDYRGRGLLKMMINKSNIEKPYLVQTSVISPIGLWQKMGCNVVKEIGDGNKIEKCN